MGAGATARVVGVWAAAASSHRRERAGGAVLRGRAVGAMMAAWMAANQVTAASTASAAYLAPGVSTAAAERSRWAARVAGVAVVVAAVAMARGAR